MNALDIHTHTSPKITKIYIIGVSVVSGFAQSFPIDLKDKTVNHELYLNLLGLGISRTYVYIHTIYS